MVAHAGRHDAVTRCGCTAALDVAKNRHARVKTDRLVDLLADLDRAASALGDDDHVMCLTA